MINFLKIPKMDFQPWTKCEMNKDILRPIIGTYTRTSPRQRTDRA